MELYGFLKSRKSSGGYLSDRHYSSYFDVKLFNSHFSNGQPKFLHWYDIVGKQQNWKSPAQKTEVALKLLNLKRKYEAIKKVEIESKNQIQIQQKESQSGEENLIEEKLRIRVSVQF